VTPASKRFLLPEAIKRISRLDLRARRVVEGFLSGMHRSPYFGQSVEFLQHREYAPGDDLRHVDWKVWARQDRLTIKQYEEETNLRCTLVVDVSHSMQYGNGPLNKYEYACTVAACMAYLVLKQQDAIGCLTFDQGIRNQTPVRSKRNHLHSIIDSLAVSQPREKTDIYGVLQAVAEKQPQRGMIMLISDLFADPDATMKGLGLLRRRGHDVLVFHLMDDDELDFPFTGPTRFEGLETPDALNCDPRALREEYLRVVGGFVSDIRRRCAREMIDYALIRTRQPLDAVLAAYLSNRLGMHHRN